AIKPTFALPLGLLLVADGAWAAIVRGALLSAGGVAVVAVPLVRAAGGVAALVASIADDAASFVTKPDVVAGGGGFRVDLASTLARWVHGELPGAVETALGVVVLALGAAAVHHLSPARDSRARLLAACTACATIVTSGYHQTYDLLLMTLPLVATVWGALPLPETAWRGFRALLATALMLP